MDDGGNLINNVREGGLVRPEDVMEMLFNSPDKASHFYEQYSRGKVFAMRVNMKLRNKNGYVDDHNHELFSPKLVEYLPPYRKMSDVDVAYMDSLQKVGISIPKIYKSLASQASGFDFIPFTKRDIYNKVRCQRGIRKGDVNATIRMSQDDYKIFGDVLVFDAMHRPNNYNLPVIIFSGVNYHNQTCVFGDAVVSCETQATYV
ncbi:hypothetical protein AHAS_Ahas02G0152500 [Arachis hypogaea]